MTDKLKKLAEHKLKKGWAEIPYSYNLYSNRQTNQSDLSSIIYYFFGLLIQGATY